MKQAEKRFAFSSNRLHNCTIDSVSGSSGSELTDFEDQDVDFNLLSSYLMDDPDDGSSCGQSTEQSSTEHSTDISFVTASDSLSTRKRARDHNEVNNYDEGSDDEEDLDGDDGCGGMRADKRRERNRVLARKTRLRKKFFFEGLQRQVGALARENTRLKKIVHDHTKGEIKQQILGNCSSEIPAIVAANTNNATSCIERADFTLMQAIQASQRSFCVTDPSLPDNPIVYASQGFLNLTGYSSSQVLGRNCRFLQGPETNLDDVRILRESVMKGKDSSALLINYKADGTKFYNKIFMAALRDENEKIVNYVGVQCEIEPKGKVDSEEDYAAFCLPVAKKGRPRTKDREKEKADKAAAKLRKQEERAAAKEAKEAAKAAMKAANCRVKGKLSGSKSATAVSGPATKQDSDESGASYGAPLLIGANSTGVPPIGMGSQSLTATMYATRDILSARHLSSKLAPMTQQYTTIPSAKGEPSHYVPSMPLPTCNFPTGTGTGAAAQGLVDSVAGIYSNIDVMNMLFPESNAPALESIAAYAVNNCLPPGYTNEPCPLPGSSLFP